MAQMRRSGSGNNWPVLPRTITSRILSTDVLKALTNNYLLQDDGERKSLVDIEVRAENHSYDNANCLSSILAGLHACGDLSVTMLRTFLECTEVKAIVSIGCCYNLLSEQGLNNGSSDAGFPMSYGLRSTSFCLGKNSRDLACQSADRWRNLEKDAGVNNFELHAFRAAFQMLLSKHFPDIVTMCPAIGRQGKTLRRRQQRRMLGTQACHQKNDDSIRKDRSLDSQPVANNLDCGVSKLEADSEFLKSSLFENFSMSALSRLGLSDWQEIDFRGIWREAEPLCDLIGPYWSLRAALGPVLETLILLDRLLFLQEQGSSVEAMLLPIFDPAISPRNIAVIAKRVEDT